MGVFDKFINAIRINDYEEDYDGDEKEFYDEDPVEDDPVEEEKPKKGLFSRIVNRDKDDDYDEEESFESKPEPARPAQTRQAAAPAKPAVQKPQRVYSPKVTPIKRKGGSPMEVFVIKPTSMEDTREIADTLLSNCTVVLNLEGIDVELAQRVIDFTSGACYSIDGSLQKVSSYIFILTPSNVEISGDITDILNSTTGNSGF